MDWGKETKLPNYLEMEWAGICTLLAGKETELPSYLEWAGIHLANWKRD